MIHLSAGWLCFSFIFLVILEKFRLSLTLWKWKIIHIVLIFTGVVLFMETTLFFTHYKADWRKFLWDYTHIQEEVPFGSLTGGGDMKMFVSLTGEEYTLFSLKHLADFINECIFLSPMVIPLLLCIKIPRDKQHKHIFTFICLTALGFVIYAFFWEADLGFPRDWDLFAMSGIFLTFCVIYFNYLMWNDKIKVILLITICLNTAHIAPWIATNAMGKHHSRKLAAKFIWKPPHETRFTVLRAYDFPNKAGENSVTIPLKWMDQIDSIELYSVVTLGTPFDKIDVKIIVMETMGDPMVLTPTIPRNEKTRIYDLSLNHVFERKIKPVYIRLEFNSERNFSWRILSMQLIQNKSQKSVQP